MDFYNTEYYENRELSWLKFDRRVLDEARDKTIPLLERLKFVSITSSNLDEFFMVRVASLKDMVHANYKKRDIAGMTASEQLEKINECTRKLVTLQYSTLNKSLMPLMAENGIKIITRYEDLTKDQEVYIEKYFYDNIYPVLTPMAVDSSRPFPLIRNKSLNIAALIRKNGDKEEEFATVQVPSGLSRLVEIPDDNENVFILLEQIIEKYTDKLFLNHEVICASPYRIMRNADFTIDEDEASDLLNEIEHKLKMRQWGEVIRLEVEDSVDKRILKYLGEKLEITDKEIYKIQGPIDLTFLMKLYGINGHDNLKYEGYTPRPVPEFAEGGSVFDIIKKGDILMHHPYQSFDAVVNFIKEASCDKDVLAIKMTLYRVSGNSPIIAALADAAENGKQVFVLVELKARFDEENNIGWARMLEKAGCHVIYGVVGLKTHSKIAMVVRREEDGIKRYVHLGTGNYNDSTAKLYTDCGMFTCSDVVGEDASAVFNMISGYSEPESWNRLVVAPIWMRDKFLKLIEREEKNATNGKKAHIVAKMNSLCDRDVIAALYKASAAGVKIELIVRGICCLRVGIKGVSENIHVRSIVGNFLEHSRIFYFYNDGNEEVYMGSADWMPRNLDKRIEIVFPVTAEKLKKQAMHILELELADNVKASVLKTDGTYEKKDKRGKSPVNSQWIFCEEAISDSPEDNKIYKERLFKPLTEFNR
ncbi:MAG: RNA degradosome polyphosphate kinase [Lachnospiraceae bacterium]|nr:RNA degradosome polyphosphate kinase [Lachnospiraceae bacterium]